MVERKKLKYISLFSGIGAFEKGLKRIGIPYELIGFSEIDKYAVRSYCAIHNEDESKNLGDITKIDEKTLPTNIDLVSYGFPCQDISIAGKKQGLFHDDGTQTRSGLFFDALRIIEHTQPKVAIAENVKNLTSKRFNAQFQVVLASLESAGYNNYWQVLNAKDYGVPQNRERVLIVSIRKDIDTGFFRFPERIPLRLRLKDIMEDEVAEKYYLGDEITQKVLENLREIKTKTLEDDKDDPRLHVACNLYESGVKGFNRAMGDVLYTSGICKTLDTMQGGNRQPKVLIEPAIQRIDIPQTVKIRKYPVDCELLCECLRKHKFALNISNKDIAETLDVPMTKVEHWFRQDDCFAIPDPDIWMQLKELLKIETDEFDEAIMAFEEKQGVYEKSERHYFADGIAPTLTSASAGNEKIITVYEEVEPVCLNSKGGRNGIEGLQPSVQDRIYDSNAISTAITTGFMPSFTHGIRVRKLTPKECFRLMDFDDEDFEKAEAVNSNTQLYKQAGNSIVVAVICYIIQALYDAKIFEEIIPNERMIHCV